MAIGTPAGPIAMASASAATATTGSFTPSANCALFAFGTARKLSATIVTPVITDSLGLTWTALANVNYDPGSNPRLAAQLYVAFPGASPSAMTVTATSTGAGGTGVTVVEVTGASVTAADYTNAIAGSVNASGDPTATLGSSPAAASGVLGFAFGNATNIFTSPTGFTAIQESTIATAYRVESAYDITSPTAGPHAWSSTNTASFALLAEVPEPAAGGTSHATTGTLTGQGSVIAGSSAHIARHTTTGVLTGQGAAIAGTAAHRVRHVTSGVLTGQGATVTGSAARTRQHATTGVLAGAGATIAGSAARSSGASTHNTSGSLTGQGAVLTGVSLRYRLHATTGVLVGASSALSGLAAHRARHVTSGAISGQGSIIVGAAVNESGSIWTPASPVSGTWTPNAGASGIWTQDTPASGNWT